MEQPWQQPPEPDTDAENLPLAGLLAELLASSQTSNEAAPESSGFSFTEQDSFCLTGSASQPPAEAPDLLRALDGAENSRREAESAGLSGLLLARLLDQPSPGAMDASGELKQEAPAAITVTGDSIQPLQPDSRPPEMAAPSGVADRTGASQPPESLELPVSAESTEIGPSAAEELVIEPPLHATPPPAPAPGEEREPPDRGSGTGTVAPECDALPAEPAGEDATAASAREQSLAPPQSGPSPQPLPASRAGASPEPAPEFARGGVLAPGPVSLSPSAPSPALQHPFEDDEDFELVDAERAERMVDRLLDAARSVFQSAPAAPPLSAGPPAPPSSAETAAQSAERESVSRGWPAAGPEAPQEETELAALADGRRPEEQAPEASPIPPAVALMALGLPERLRARLESIGNLDQALLGRPPLAPAPEQGPRLLLFRVGGQSCALHMEHIREVERVGRVTAVPGAPGFVKGLIQLRGEILPLLDLGALLGLTGEPAMAARLIVAQAGPAEPPVALMVEELNGLAPLREESVAPAWQPGLYRGSIEHRGRSEISDRTSILALHASIPAAAAGESGKGFAIVA